MTLTAVLLEALSIDRPTLWVITEAQ